MKNFFRTASNENTATSMAQQPNVIELNEQELAQTTGASGGGNCNWYGDDCGDGYWDSCGRWHSYHHHHHHHHCDN